MIRLGVDGGGTKTAGVLTDDDGTVLASATVGGTYYLADGVEAVRQRLDDLIGALCSSAGIERAQVASAFFGLPGYGEIRADTPTLDALPRAVLGHDRYACGNDMVCAWAGSLGGADGVNVIAGTGSMTYGERAGRGTRVGGWGEVFGDEGSAHWIGIEGLRAASRMSDGRLPRGPLLPALRDHLGVDDDLGLLDVVLHRWRGARGRVAGLAPVVDAAATAGDTAATAILTAAGGELALLVTTTAETLEWPPEDTLPVSWSGGVFGSTVVRAAFARALTAAPRAVDLREPERSPALGAALLATRI